MMEPIIKVIFNYMLDDEVASIYYDEHLYITNSFEESFVVKNEYNEEYCFRNREHQLQFFSYLLNKDDYNNLLKYKILSVSNFFDIRIIHIEDDQYSFRIRKRLFNVIKKDLFRKQICTPDMYSFIEQKLLDRKSIMICGSSDTGKSRLANSLYYLLDKYNSIYIYQKSDNLLCLVSNYYNSQDVYVDDLVEVLSKSNYLNIFIDMINSSKLCNVYRELKQLGYVIITTVIADDIKWAVRKLYTYMLAEYKDIDNIYSYLDCVLEMITIRNTLEESKNKNRINNILDEKHNIIYKYSLYDDTFQKIT